MSVIVQTEKDGQLLQIHFTGRLTKEDYLRFLPAVEQAIGSHSKVSMLVDMHDFHGWDAGAAGEDFKFGAHHRNHIDRLAVVGERTWQRWATILCKPFTNALVRYFDQNQLQKAQDWLHEDRPTATN